MLHAMHLRRADRVGNYARLTPVGSGCADSRSRVRAPCPPPISPGTLCVIIGFRPQNVNMFHCVSFTPLLFQRVVLRLRSGVSCGAVSSIRCNCQSKPGEGGTVGVHREWRRVLLAVIYRDDGLGLRVLMGRVFPRIQALLSSLPRRIPDFRFFRKWRSWGMCSAFPLTGAHSQENPVFLQQALEPVVFLRIRSFDAFGPDWHSRYRGYSVAAF